jgi:hypothetical protein
MERLTAAEEEYHRLQVRRGRAALPGGDADAVKKLDADLAAAAAKLDRLERERARRNSVAANVQQTVSRIDSFVLAWFSGASGVAPPPRVTVVPRRRAGESVADAVVRLRDEIGRVRAELAHVRAAPLPAKEVKAAIAAGVDRMAREGAPRVRVDGGRVELVWPDVQPFAAPNQALAAPSGSASKLMCWLHRDRIVAELTAEFPAKDAPGAIPAGDRPGRIRALEEKLFALEVEEEFFVAQAIADGLEAHRRPDASPFAILGWGLQPQPVAEAAE